MHILLWAGVLALLPTLSAAFDTLPVGSPWLRAVAIVLSLTGVTLVYLPIWLIVHLPVRGVQVAQPPSLDARSTSSGMLLGSMPTLFLLDGWRNLLDNTAAVLVILILVGCLISVIGLTVLHGLNRMQRRWACAVAGGMVVGSLGGLLSYDLVPLMALSTRLGCAGAVYGLIFALVTQPWARPRALP